MPFSERKVFSPSDPEQRRVYKLALIAPYLDVIEPEVIEAMLDLDLVQLDGISRYELQLQTGEVEERINASPTHTVKG